MKKIIKISCLSFMAMLIALGSFLSAYAKSSVSDADKGTLNDDTCYMYKDGDGYRFVGPCGDASDGFVNEADTVKPYKEAEISEEASKSKTELAEVGSNPLPKSVDLSESEYFPPVGDQGSLGSCAVFSCVYYQFTYHMNEKRGVASTAENAASPLFVFNFTSYGSELGTTYGDNYRFLMEHGAPSQKTVPYETSGVLDWHADFDTWREASRFRLESYEEYEDVGTEDAFITSADDSDLNHYKKALSEGKLLGFSTNVSSWKSVLLKENPDAPGNKNYVGQHSVVYADGYDGPHRMTIVGYNDEIWTDINNNDKVDAGEMGAFKIVNSWGTSYCNGGFVWVAYDSINQYKSSVEGVNLKYRSSTITWVTSCEVREYAEDSELYLAYTLNTSKRVQHEVEVIAEKNGTVTKKKVFYLLGYQSANNDGGFDGGADASDGTFVYCLDNVIEDIKPSEFEDYSWSVVFRDTENDSNPLIVKDIKIVNDATGKSYSPDGTLPVTLDGSEKEIFLKDTTRTHKVIYYLGYHGANLHYKTADGEFAKVKMEDSDEREGYASKYVIENCPEDVILYFSDDNGNVDNNNGEYFKAQNRLNYYTTENAVDELKINDITFINGDFDLEKRMVMSIDTVGGYKPYHYQMTVEDLTTGQVYFRDFTYMWYIQEPGFVFRSLGEYRIFMEVKDQSGKIVGFEKIIETQDLPFEFTELTADKSAFFPGESICFTVTSKNEGVFSHGPSKNIYDFVVKDSGGNLCYTLSKNYDFSDLNERYSKTSVDFIPQKTGKYTVSVSSTDIKNQSAEISLEFTVVDKTIGDANGDGAVSVKDATLIQKYVAELESDQAVVSELCDCDGKGSVTVKDATCVRKFLAHIEGYCRTGEIIEYIPPETQPVTETTATEAPTEEPTSPVQNNVVTFTNSLNWSGTIYCYYWSDENTAMTSWPGTPMTNSGTNQFGETLYTFNVPAGATKIIFSNGSAQTVDIEYPGGEVRYYAENVNSGNGYNVKTW